MRGALTIGILCGALTACSVPSPWTIPDLGNPPGNLAADRAACTAKFPERVGNYLAHAQCVNEAVEHDAIPTARYPDLVRLQEQLRLKYSGMIDSGAVSARVGEHKMVEADELVAAAMRDRDAGRREVSTHLVTQLHAMLE